MKSTKVRIRNLEEQLGNFWNCRCPICGKIFKSCSHTFVEAEKVLKKCIFELKIVSVLEKNKLI